HRAGGAVVHYFAVGADSGDGGDGVSGGGGRGGNSVFHSVFIHVRGGHQAGVSQRPAQQRARRADSGRHHRRVDRGRAGFFDYRAGHRVVVYSAGGSDEQIQFS